MDRSSFLNALPFLLPTSLSAWPRSEDRSIQVLLNNKETFHLSVEPVIGKPAFFATNGKEDPAMMSIELALDCSNARKTSPNLLPIHGNRTTPTTTDTTTTTPTLLCLYARVDCRIFAVDVTTLEHLHLVNDDDDHRVESMAASPASLSNKNKPPSLVLQFASCALRIFSSLPFYDDLEALQQTQHCLSTYMSSQHASAWRQGWASAFALVAQSPCGSSTTTTTSSSEGHNQQKKKKRPASPSEQRRTRRRRLYQDCQDCLHQLQDVLWSPVPKKRDNEGATTTPTTLGALLTRTAESLVYDDDDNAAAIIDSQWSRQQAEQCRQEMHQQLQALFPSRKSRTVVVPPPTDGRRRLQELLQQQKEALQERAKLLLALPSR